MATRSTIAIQNADGTVTGIYCHWDGGFWCNGPLLNKHYTDEAAVRELIALGDLSSLGETVGSKVDFNTYRGSDQCVAYGRDRGETGVDAETYDSWAALLEAFGQEFNYLFVPGTGWLVDYGESSGLLAEEMAKEAAEA